MSRRNNKKKGQAKILNEIKTQLMMQADKWGMEGEYSPLKLEELKLEQCRKIKGDFLAERANLEYEMSVLGTDKKEILIKTEKLDTYIRKTEKQIQAYEKKITKILDKQLGDKNATKNAVSKIVTQPRISVMIDR